MAASPRPMAANGVSAAACQALSAALITDNRKQGVPGLVACRTLAVHCVRGNGSRYPGKQVAGENAAFATSWCPAVPLKNFLWSCQACWSDHIRQAFPLQVRDTALSSLDLFSF